MSIIKTDYLTENSLFIHSRVSHSAFRVERTTDGINTAKYEYS